MGRTTATSIAVQQLVNATGGTADVDVKDLKGQMAFILNAKSSNGTNPTDTVKLQHSNLADGASQVVVGATENELRDGTDSNIKFAAAFTQSGARQIKKVLIPLKKNGAVASGNLTLTIEADSSGDPSGTPLGTATFSTDNLPTTGYEYVTFEFATPIEVADATTYHVVLAGAYSVSATVNVTWRSKTVASGGNLSYFDSGWAQTATEDLEFIVREYNFADVTGGAYTQATSTASMQVINLNIDDLGRYMRAYNTIGGTSSPAFYMSVAAYGYTEN